MKFVPYDASAAVRYAHRWAYGRNPDYYDYENIGGDCTNFASQCLFAGTGVMNFTPTFGWYYRNANDKAPAWTGVEYLYRFLMSREVRPGPFALETDIFGIRPGDILQLQLDGDPKFDHTPVVVHVGEMPCRDNILVAAHSQNADFRPLSTYPVRSVRYLHIPGAWSPQPHPGL